MARRQKSSRVTNQITTGGGGGHQMKQNSGVFTGCRPAVPPEQQQQQLQKPPVAQQQQQQQQNQFQRPFRPYKRFVPKGISNRNRNNGNNGNNHQPQPHQPQPQQSRGPPKKPTSYLPFICRYQDCGHRCPQIRDLREHDRTHSRLKPFHCRLCDYHCACQSTIIDHISGIHFPRKTLEEVFAESGGASNMKTRTAVFCKYATADEDDLDVEAVEMDQWVSSEECRQLIADSDLAMMQSVSGNGNSSKMRTAQPQQQPAGNNARIVAQQQQLTGNNTQIFAQSQQQKQQPNPSPNINLGSKKRPLASSFSNDDDARQAKNLRQNSVGSSENITFTPHQVASKEHSSALSAAAAAAASNYQLPPVKKIRIFSSSSSSLLKTQQQKQGKSQKGLNAQMDQLQATISAAAMADKAAASSSSTNAVNATVNSQSSKSIDCIQASTLTQSTGTSSSSKILVPPFPSAAAVAAANDQTQPRRSIPPPGLPENEKNKKSSAQKPQSVAAAAAASTTASKTITVITIYDDGEIIEEKEEDLAPLPTVTSNGPARRNQQQQQATTSAENSAQEEEGSAGARVAEPEVAAAVAAETAEPEAAAAAAPSPTVNTPATTTATSNNYTTTFRPDLSSPGAVAIKKMKLTPRMLVCGRCSRTNFGSFQEFFYHEWIHLGLKPYTCTFNGCNRTFRQRSTARLHLNSVHRGQQLDSNNNNTALQNGGQQLFPDGFILEDTELIKAEKLRLLSEVQEN